LIDEGRALGLRFQFVLDGRDGKAAEGGLVGGFAVFVKRGELGVERIVIEGLVGLLMGLGVAEFGALGPAEFDFAEPDENTGFAILGFLPDGGKKNDAAFGAALLEFGGEDFGQQGNGDAQQRSDVVVIQADAGVGYDGLAFDFGDRVQVGLAEGWGGGTGAHPRMAIRGLSRSAP